MGREDKKPKKKSRKVSEPFLQGKRALSRHGTKRQKGKEGPNSWYITRSAACRRLQTSLKDFRRLCILKGIYPREPEVKGSSQVKGKSHYHLKDIRYLAHEPLLAKFRSLKSFMKKVSHQIGSRNLKEASRLYQLRPSITLDHLIRERYPKFEDALEDLDDALSLIFLYANLPSINLPDEDSKKMIPFELCEKCELLGRQWNFYTAQSQSLSKVFVSVKGIYFRSEISSQSGQKITWLVPHKFSQNIPDEVDFRVMNTFCEFYIALLGFVMFKLYFQSGLRFPPMLDQKRIQNGEFLSSFKNVMNGEDDDEEDDDGKEKLLFSNFVFFLSREVPFEASELAILGFGGRVIANGNADHKDITHYITDRKVSFAQERLDQIEVVQPQWIFDSINNNTLLPTSMYSALDLEGKELPPHLSPFVDDVQEGYVPAFRTKLDQLVKESSLTKSKSGSNFDDTIVKVDDNVAQIKETDHDLERDATSDDDDDLEEEKQEIESDSDDDQDDDEAAAESSFIKSKKFDGARKGMMFKKGAKGLGYYPLPKQQSVDFKREQPMSNRQRKRKEMEDAKGFGQIVMKKGAKHLYNMMKSSNSKKKQKVDALKKKRKS